MLEKKFCLNKKNVDKKKMVDIIIGVLSKQGIYKQEIFQELQKEIQRCGITKSFYKYGLLC